MSDPRAASSPLQATLTPDCAPGTKVCVQVKVNEDEVFICTLKEGVQESMSLDFNFTSYTEFTLVGAEGAVVHLAGYIASEESEAEEDDDEDDDPMEALEGSPVLEELLGGEDRAKFLDLLQQQRNRLSLEDSDDEALDEEDDSEDSSEDDEDPLGKAARRLGRGKGSVIIEDITDEPTATETRATDGGVAAGKAVGADSRAKKVAKAIKDAKARLVEESLEAAAMDEESTSEDDEEIVLGEEDTSSDGEGESDDAASSDESGDEGDEEKEDDVIEDKKPQDQKSVGAKQKDATGAKGKRKAAEIAPESNKKTKLAAAKATATAQATKPGSKAIATADDEPKQGGKGAGKGAIRKYPNGFIVESLSMGPATGKISKAGNRVVVKYAGRLATTGKQFDATKGKKGFTFRLGIGEVIKGWDQGVVGMRVGDKRRLTVPPQMGYGAEGIKGVIPGNATLVFDVELLDVK